MRGNNLYRTGLMRLKNGYKRAVYFEKKKMGVKGRQDPRNTLTVDSGSSLSLSPSPEVGLDFPEY